MSKKLKTVQGYPLLSAVFSVLLMMHLMILSLLAEIAEIPFLSAIAQSYQSYSYLASTQLTLSLFALFILVLLWDIQRFLVGRKVVKKNTNKLRKEIEDVWQSKKHLQNKAHTYSGHADKLKLFISDKLLEYIEYDEKFLHFKSIASEVRHNGVISYDIVTSLLNDILARDEDELRDLDSHQVKKSLEAMRYLWDLLDLSTADNLALHIANQLINAEEQYYQMELEKSDDRDSLTATASLLPADFYCLTPVFSSLGHLVHEPDGLSQQLADAIPIQQWSFYDDQFSVSIKAEQTLLGNPNHVRLMLENLLKNAQHFSRKTLNKQKTDRILLSVIEGPNTEEASYTEFQVYNRGPHILDEHRSKLFQLGYSTRRTREHHGKGLGLFFVNEIVKGYEGQLVAENIVNVEDDYSIRIQLKNGEVETQRVNVSIIDNKPVILNSDLGLKGDLDDDALDSRREGESSQKWQYTSPIESVEVSSNRMPKTSRFQLDEQNKTESYLQPAENQMNYLAGQLLPASWSLTIQPKRGGNKTHNVSFILLDIAGVRFSIKLPTAKARLEGVEPNFSEQGEFTNTDEMKALQQYFIAPE